MTPLAQGKLFAYQPGSVVPVTVYRDYAQTVAWPSPIVLTDATFPGGAGYVPGVIYPPVGDPVKYVLQDALGAQLWVADPVPPVIGTDIAANVWVFFQPTWLNTGTANQLGGSALVGYYRMIGKTTVQLYIGLQFAADMVIGSGQFSFGNLPFAPAFPAGLQVMAAQYGQGAVMGLGYFSTGPLAVTPFRAAVPGLFAQAAYTATVPFTWGDRDVVGLWGSYEI